MKVDAILKKDQIPLELDNLPGIIVIPFHQMIHGITYNPASIFCQPLF